MNNAFGIGTVSDDVQARIWASTAGTNASVNLVVDNTGKIYSKAGKIGGWNIEKNKLWAGNSSDGTNGIRLNADGSMNGGNGTYGSWAIYNNGTSSFDHVTATNMTASTVTATNITANDLYAENGGRIAGWEIGADSLTGGSMVINSSGSMSGPGWYITANGDASFANGSATFSGSGGTGTIGGNNFNGSSLGLDKASLNGEEQTWNKLIYNSKLSMRL